MSIDGHMAVWWNQKYSTTFKIQNVITTKPFTVSDILCGTEKKISWVLDLLPTVTFSVGLRKNWNIVLFTETYRLPSAKIIEVKENHCTASLLEVCFHCNHWCWVTVQNEQMKWRNTLTTQHVAILVKQFGSRLYMEYEEIITLLYWYYYCMSYLERSISSLVSFNLHAFSVCWFVLYIKVSFLKWDLFQNKVPMASNVTETSDKMIEVSTESSFLEPGRD